MANTGLSEWKAAKMINFHSYFPRSNYQRHCIIFVIIALSCIFTISSTNCQVKLSYPTLEALQYNGSWFVIAHKAPSSHSFLPSSVKSSLIKLQIDGENLNMTEYHSIDDTCMPSLSGIWTKKQDSYLMEVRTATGQLFSMDLRAIYHDYSGEQNEEMNLVIYGCSKTDSYG
uniref:Lipocln_cytosolic_FA-bd_dom domain-containing protein n=1 Tax=Heterorhabditis bacteriophora TaxID=37862 RepID=A0A1I7XAB8_HETBA